MAHPLTVPALRAATLDPPGAGFAQPLVSLAVQVGGAVVRLGLGRIVVLHYHSPTLCQFHEHIRHLSVSETTMRPDPTMRLDLSGSETCILTENL
jgi:hypothetical protein